MPNLRACISQMQIAIHKLGTVQYVEGGGCMQWRREHDTYGTYTNCVSFIPTIYLWCGTPAFMAITTVSESVCMRACEHACVCVCVCACMRTCAWIRVTSISIQSSIAVRWINTHNSVSYL